VKEINPDLIRILQAYPAYIRGLGLISPQIGYFRLILPNLGSLGYIIKTRLNRDLSGLTCLY